MRHFPLRLIVLGVIMLVMLWLPAAVSAMDTEVRVYVDGQLIATNIPAELVDDRPYIPESFVRRELGVLSVWDAENRILALERDVYHAQFVLNESYVLIDGAVHRLDAPPIVLSNEIYLPARALGESLGIKVTWDIVNQALQFYLPKQDVLVGDDTGSVGWDREPVIDQETVPDANSGPTDKTDDVSSASPRDPTGDAVIGSIEIVRDQIIISADGKLSAQMFALTDPHRLVIDIPYSKIGSMLNGQPAQLNGTLSSTHPHIRQIRYALFKNDPSTIRLVVDLSQQVQYSIVKQDDPNKLILDIVSQKFQVVLDAGHGGKDPGAITYSKWYEKDFTLPFTMKVYDLLLEEPFIKPVLTRSDDTFIELDQRSAIANDIEADLFLSFHGNTYIPSVHGTESYYYHATSKRFAETVHKHVVKATGFRDRNVRQQDYKVLRLANMPAALIEIGYVSNKDQEALLYDEQFQHKVAEAVVDAIKEYLGL